MSRWWRLLVSMLNIFRIWSSSVLRRATEYWFNRTWPSLADDSLWFQMPLPPLHNVLAIAPCIQNLSVWLHIIWIVITCTERLRITKNVGRRCGVVSDNTVFFFERERGAAVRFTDRVTLSGICPQMSKTLWYTLNVVHPSLFSTGTFPNLDLGAGSRGTVCLHGS